VASGTATPNDLWYSMQVQNNYTGVSAYFQAIGAEDNSGFQGTPYSYTVYLTGGTRTTTSNYISAWNFIFLSGLPKSIQENKYVGIRYAYDNKIYIFQIPTPLIAVNTIVMPRDALYIG